MTATLGASFISLWLMIAAYRTFQPFNPAFCLADSNSLFFKNFVDGYMAKAWVGDTFSILPGNYGQGALWGEARDLKFACGPNHDVVFKSDSAVYTCQRLLHSMENLHDTLLIAPQVGGVEEAVLCPVRGALLEEVLHEMPVWVVRLASNSLL